MTSDHNRDPEHTNNTHAFAALAISIVLAVTLSACEDPALDDGDPIGDSTGDGDGDNPTETAGDGDHAGDGDGDGDPGPNPCAPGMFGCDCLPGPFGGLCAGDLIGCINGVCALCTAGELHCTCGPGDWCEDDLFCEPLYSVCREPIAGAL